MVLILSAAVPTRAQQGPPTRVEQAIEFIQRACATGSKVEVNGDARGNINITSFRPGGQAHMQFSRLDDRGSVSIEDAKKRVEADKGY
jgi:hypothetical protein